MTDPGWVVTPKDAPAELAEGFQAEPYADREPLRTGTDWVPLEEKLDAAGMALLMRFGAIGDPNGNAGTATD